MVLILLKKDDKTLSPKLVRGYFVRNYDKAKLKNMYDSLRKDRRVLYNLFENVTGIR